VYDSTVAEWKQLQVTNGPIARVDTAIVKQNEDIFYIMGGRSYKTSLNDLWKYDVTQNIWTEIQVKSSELPESRSQHCLALYRNVLVIVGGFSKSNKQLTTDVWSIDLAKLEWWKISPKDDHVVFGLTCSVVAGNLYVVSGDLLALKKENTIERLDLEDLHTEQEQEWETVAILHDIDGYATRIWFNSFEYQDNLYWFGGREVSKAVNGIMKYDPSSKSTSVYVPSSDTPLATSFHTMVQIGNKAIVYGGTGEDGVVNNLSILDVDSLVWTIPIIYGPKPTPRTHHSAAVFGDQMIIYAGETTNGEILGDMWSFSLSSMSWYQIQDKPDQLAGFPVPRTKHTSTSNQTHLIVYGGNNEDGYLHDIWILNMKTFRWTLLNDVFISPDGGSGAHARGIKHTGDVLHYHQCLSSMWDKDHLIISGCNDEYGWPVNGFALFDFRDNSWVLYSNTNSSILVLSGVAVVETSTHQLLVYGGTLREVMYDKFYRVDAGDPVEQEHQEPHFAEIPSGTVYPAPRANHKATYYGNRMIIFGGGGSSPGNNFATNAVYSDTWQYLVAPICDPNNKALGCLECSKGSVVVGDGDGCQTCEVGEYQDEVGATECKKCPTGTYGSLLGAQSIELCLPCPYGSYNDKQGQTQCFRCPDQVDVFCPVGSVVPVRKAFSDATVATADFYNAQERQKDNNTTVRRIKFIIVSSLLAFTIVVAVLLSICFCIGMIKADGTVKKARHLDLFFDMAHNVREGSSPIAKKTVMGFILSIISLLLIAVLVTWSLFDYFGLNFFYLEAVDVRPIVIPNGTYFQNVTFYGMDCRVEPPDINITHIEGKVNVVVTSDPINRACNVQWYCTNGVDCTVTSVGVQTDIVFTQFDALFYSFDYSVSVPHFKGRQYNYTGARVLANPGSVFRGADPTNLDILITHQELEELKSNALAYFGGTNHDTTHGLGVQTQSVDRGAQQTTFSTSNRGARLIVLWTLNPTTQVITETTSQSPLNILGQLYALACLVLALNLIIFPYIEDGLMTCVRRRANSPAVVIIDPNNGEKMFVTPPDSSIA
jgi:N-acetylneuraminic acid mutarotase